MLSLPFVDRHDQPTPPQGDRRAGLRLDRHRPRRAQAPAPGQTDCPQRASGASPVLSHNLPKLSRRSRLLERRDRRYRELLRSPSFIMLLDVHSCGRGRAPTLGHVGAHVFPEAPAAEASADLDHLQLEPVSTTGPVVWRRVWDGEGATGRPPIFVDRHLDLHVLTLAPGRRDRELLAERCEELLYHALRDRAHEPLPDTAEHAARLD